MDGPHYWLCKGVSMEIRVGDWVRFKAMGNELLGEVAILDQTHYNSQVWFKIVGQDYWVENSKVLEVRHKEEP